MNTFNLDKTKQVSKSSTCVSYAFDKLTRQETVKDFHHFLVKLITIGPFGTLPKSYMAKICTVLSCPNKKAFM